MIGLVRLFVNSVSVGDVDQAEGNSEVVSGELDCTKNQALDDVKRMPAAGRDAYSELITMCGGGGVITKWGKLNTA